GRRTSVLTPPDIAKCKCWTSRRSHGSEQVDANPSQSADAAPPPSCQGAAETRPTTDDTLTNDTDGHDAGQNPQPTTGPNEMAFTAETGDHKVTRSDIFLVDPRALVVDWKKNLSRNGEEPPVDEALVELAKDMMPKKGQGDSEDGSSGQLNPILTRPLPDR